MFGPYQIGVEYYRPFRFIFYDFFTQEEINWIISFTRPKLSSRKIYKRSQELKNSGQKSQNTLIKTVQAWFHDIIYDETEILTKTGSPEIDHIYDALPMSRPYSFTVESKVMLKISRRIEIATKLNMTTRYGSSPYQVTHYGLGGSVDSHLDPKGYESGTRLTTGTSILARSGDYIATFMGWLNDVPAGGGTMFSNESAFGLLKPKKGAAAFWINLKSCHMRDFRALHGGCPILSGSKWILNKWIYSWDQWTDWPCKISHSLTIDPFQGMS